MTAVAPAGRAAPPRSAVPSQTAGGRHGTGKAGPLRRIADRGTPAVLQAAMGLLVILSLAWGGLGAWAVSEHASSANSLAHGDYRLSRDAQQLYLALADADVTMTTAFLAGTPPTLKDRQHFDADLNAAAGYLADLSGSSDSPQLTAAVAAIGNGMQLYGQHIATAETEFAQGITPAGDSFMEVASEDAHLTLLPSARKIYALENNAVTASSAGATSLPTIILALGVGLLATGIALLWSQRWLARRTRRVFNLGLLAATVALAISGVWLAATFGIARSDLSTAIGQGAHPAEALAQASIDVQQIRSDSVLNVIARSGSTSLAQDSAAEATAVGPGTGSLLDAALADGNAQAAPYIHAAGSAAPVWYKANERGYALGQSFEFRSEEQAVTGPENSGYEEVLGEINHAIGAAQGTFQTQADAGSGAFGPLEAVVIVAALLMAAASAWGLSRRIAEYR